MKKIILGILFFPTSVFSQIGEIELPPFFSIEENLFNTSDIKLIDNETLLIVDNNLNYPLYTISIKNNKVEKQVNRGRGPGEVSGGQKDITVFKNNIYIWDLLNQRLTIFSNKMEYLESKTFKDIGFINHLMPVGGNKFLAISNKKEIINLIEEDKVTVLVDITHRYFNQFKNLALRQGFKLARNSENTTYIANEFSSLLLGINNDEINFKTILPENLVNDSFETGRNGTDISIYPIVALDIEYYNGYVYLLYKGETLPFDPSKVKNIDILISDFLNSNTVYVYDKNGEFIKEIRIPTPAKKIEINNGVLYLLSTYGNKVKIDGHNVKETR